MICKRPGCGSQAINIERDKLEKGKTVFCDVCHWRDKAERLEGERLKPDVKVRTINGEKHIQIRCTKCNRNVTNGWEYCCGCGYPLDWGRNE